MPDYLCIVNPAADRGRARVRWQAVERVLRQKRVSFDVVFTQGISHALETARAAARSGKYAALVAAGGDGTVNEVVNGLCLASGDGGNCALGIFPIGSANDLATIVGIPRAPEAMVELLVTHRTRLVDVGLVESPDIQGPTSPLRYFINNCGLGFEAQVSLESRRIRRLRGFFIYLVAVFRTLIHYRQPFVQVHWDGNERAERMLLITVGNGRRAGGGFWLTPFAEIDDGWLDVGFARALNRLEILRLLPKAMHGRHVEDPAFTLARCRTMEVHTDIPIPIHTDGETVVVGTRHVQVRVLPKRVRVICDPTRPLASVR